MSDSIISSFKSEGVLAVLGAVLIWSGWIVISRMSVTHTLNAADLAAIRFGIAGLIMLPWWIKHPKFFGCYGLGGIALMFCIGAPYTFIAVGGMHYAPVSHAGIIYGVGTCVTSLLGTLFLRERLGQTQWLGIAIALTGVSALLFDQSWDGAALNPLGHALFFLSGCLIGLYSILVRLWQVPPLVAASNVCTWSLILYLPFYILFLPKHIALASEHELWTQAIYQGVITSIIGLILYNKGVSALGAARASAFIPLVPALATLISIPALGEIPSSIEWLGIALIAVGIMMATGLLVRQSRDRVETSPEIV